MATFGKESVYKGGNDALQREKRMSEWQRSMRLAPIQREEVQSRMTEDPYDRTASTRLERINEKVNADPYRNSRTSQAFRDAVALREYQNPQAQSADGYENGSYSQAQRRAQSAGQRANSIEQAINVGEINGRRVAVPTAGNYDIYRAVLGKSGLSDSPSPEAASFAMEQFQIDPNKRYAADSNVRAAQVKAYGDQLAREQKDADRKAKLEEDQRKGKLAERTASNRNQAMAMSELSKFKNRDFVTENNAKFAKALAQKGQMRAEEFKALLAASGIQFSEKMIGGRAQFAPVGAAEFAAPDRSTEEADMINRLNVQPGASRATTDYLQEKYNNGGFGPKQPAPAYYVPPSPVSAGMQAADAMQPQSQGTIAQRAIAALTSQGLSPEQARAVLLQSAAQRGPQVEQRIQQELQQLDSVGAAPQQMSQAPMQAPPPQAPVGPDAWRLPQFANRRIATQVGR